MKMGHHNTSNSSFLTPFAQNPLIGKSLLLHTNSLSLPHLQSLVYMFWIRQIPNIPLYHNI